MRSDGTCFTDHEIHTALKRKGFLQLNQGLDKNEWFNCTIKDVISAINYVRDGISTEENRTLTFKMRPEQTRAVQKTIEFFDKAKADEPEKAPKFLWNAKMRFGKTFASYQLAKKLNFKRVLVLTFKPAVESAWREDLVSHVDFEGWQFVSNKDAHDNKINIDTQFESADKSRSIVVFGSFQDLLGTNENGGIKAKNEFIHTTQWDLVIFDEYHFGAWRENAKKLFENPDEEENADFDMEHYKQTEADNAYNETFLPITTSYYLFLSGTPFRAINLGLLTKAADAGYKVIFILTGTIESLRKQTQQRVEEGFIGWDSFNGVPVGVGRGDPTPKAFTSRGKDFVGTDNQNTTYKLSNYSSEPMIFVLKKNVSVLKKVYSSLRNINTNAVQTKINIHLLLIILRIASNSLF